MSLIKACRVFLASLYSILSTLNLDFLNFLNNLSLAAIFAAISLLNHSFVLFFTPIVFLGANLFITSKKFWGLLRISFVYTTKIFIIWKCHLTQSFFVNFSWGIFHRAKCKIIVFVRFSPLDFSGAKNKLIVR